MQPLCRYRLKNKNNLLQLTKYSENTRDQCLIPNGISIQILEVWITLIAFVIRSFKTPWQRDLIKMLFNSFVDYHLLPCRTLLSDDSRLWCLQICCSAVSVCLPSCSERVQTSDQNTDCSLRSKCYSVIGSLRSLISRTGSNLSVHSAGW